MANIRLNWQDVNYGEDGHNIYRSTSPMTVGSLPAPIASLGADVTSYLDENLTDGTTYYYRVGAVWGTEEEVSAEIEIVAQDAYFYDDFEVDFSKWFVHQQTSSYGGDKITREASTPLGSYAMRVLNGDAPTSSPSTGPTNDYAQADLSGLPVDYKPTRWAFRIWIDVIDEDDVGVISLVTQDYNHWDANSNDFVAASMVLVRQDTDPQSRLHFSGVATPIKLVTGVNYQVLVQLNWTTGEATLDVSGFPQQTGLVFDNTVFPVNRIHIMNQPGGNDAGLFYIDEVSLI